MWGGKGESYRRAVLVVVVMVVSDNNSLPPKTVRIGELERDAILVCESSAGGGGGDGEKGSRVSDDVDREGGDNNNMF
ncbi:hypothetical protein Pcinc_025029 [Petrolisthes cinctipes]|uniref:Uncharacterized protein n=1 Tax=Petrolisthes cinctipes TaxID=88211 RepID=A0AAE1KDL3_PETCI|nr:hypothetical protein Pcinc_025029 [Petrolisthes cinctipes]